MTTKRDTALSNDDLVAYFKARAEKFGPPVDNKTKRNALVSKDHDNLRFEFISLLTSEFQPELADLPSAVASGIKSGDEPVRVALEWLADHSLFAPWLKAWLEGAPPSWWQSPGKPVRIWGPIGGPFPEGASRESRLAAEQEIQTPPVEALPPPRPWHETEMSFRSRCQLAWDEQLRWAKRNGFFPPEKGTRAKKRDVDMKPAYLRALARHALRGEKWEALAQELNMHDAATLRKEVRKIRRRLELGGSSDLNRWVDSAGP
jgi:hypothetical protein